MSQHDAIKNKLISAITVGALTAGALTTTGLGSAPTANATCASFFGIGNTAECTSLPTSIAIAIGPNAEAHANGYFVGAFSIGDGAWASTEGFEYYAWWGLISQGQWVTLPTAFNVAIAFGDNTASRVGGVFTAAVAGGTNATASSSADCLLCFANVAVNLGGNLSTVEAGMGNLAVNFFGDSEILNRGQFSTAVNVLGDGNVVTVDNIFGLAFNAFGSDNEVTAGGPLAVAGSILQTNATVTQVGTGFNINGIQVGEAATVDDPEPASSSAAALNTTTTTTGSAGTADADGPGTVSEPATARSAAPVRANKPTTARSARAVGTGKTGEKTITDPSAAQSTGSSKKLKAVGTGKKPAAHSPATKATGSKNAGPKTKSDR